MPPTPGTGPAPACKDALGWPPRSPGLRPASEEGGPRRGMWVAGEQPWGYRRAWQRSPRAPIPSPISVPLSPHLAPVKGAARISKCPLYRQGNRGSQSARGLPFPPQPKIPPPKQKPNKKTHPVSLGSCSLWTAAISPNARMFWDVLEAPIQSQNPPVAPKW